MCVIFLCSENDDEDQINVNTACTQQAENMPTRSEFSVNGIS